MSTVFFPEIHYAKLGKSIFVSHFEFSLECYHKKWCEISLHKHFKMLLPFVDCIFQNFEIVLDFDGYVGENLSFLKSVKIFPHFLA